MSVEAAIIQYKQQFIAAFEVRLSMLRMATMKEAMQSGLTVTFLVSGSGTDTDVTRGTNGQIPYGNPTNSQIPATLIEHHAPYELTAFNIFASQGDQKAIMQMNSMAVINRGIDNRIIAELANATTNLGATGVPASNALVQRAIAKLGANAVDTTQEDKMWALVSPAFMGYLRQIPEFINVQYVDVKTLTGSVKKVTRWNGVNWIASPLVSGLGTTAELCYMWHADALGYAVNAGEEKIALGYDEKQDTSWTRATIYDVAKITQNAGIVQIKHDGSAFA